MIKEIKMKIFLACPYGDDYEEQEFRFEQVTKYTCKLINNGHIVYSPITYGHTLNKYDDLGNKLDFWMKQNLWILESCDCLAVLKLPQWHESMGVKEEIDIAKSLNKQIWYIE